MLALFHFQEKDPLPLRLTSGDLVDILKVLATYLLRTDICHDHHDLPLTWLAKC